MAFRERLSPSRTRAEYRRTYIRSMAALNKGIFARDEHRAIRRNVLVGPPGGYDRGEHLVQRNISASQAFQSLMWAKGTRLIGNNTRRPSRISRFRAAAISVSTHRLFIL